MLDAHGVLLDVLLDVLLASCNASICYRYDRIMPAHNVGMQYQCIHIVSAYSTTIAAAPL